MVLLMGVIVVAVACSSGMWDQFRQSPARKILVGNSGIIRSISFRQDGAMLCSIGSDTSMAIVNLTTRDEDPWHPPYCGPVGFASFSPDNRLLVTTSPTATVLLHDLVDHESRTLDGDPVATFGATCLSFSPDGTSLAVGQADWRISLWDAQSRQTRSRLAAHDGIVAAMAFAPDGSTLASSGSDCKPRIWEMPAGRVRFTISKPGFPIAGAAYCTDGRLLFLCDQVSAVVWIWDLTKGLERACLRGFAGAVFAVAVSPDGTTLAAADHRGVVTFWDIATFRVLPTRLRHSGVCSLAFAPDNKVLVTGGFDGTINLWAFPLSSGD